MRPGSPLGRVLGVVAGATVALVAATASAHAAEVVAAGWWTAAPLAPDAPGDALVIEGGISEPRAYGAVRYSLAPDERADVLTLAVVPGAASTPNSTLRLCVLSEPFRPARGGSIAAAPGFDCATSVEAAPSSDGSSYAFEVAELANGDALAVAVLPTALTDRVVLAPPGDEALATEVKDDRPSPAPGPTGDRDDTAAINDPSGVGSAPWELGGGAPVPPPAGGLSGVGSGTDPATGVTAPTSAAASPAAQDGASDDASWIPPAAFLVLTIVAAALWLGRRGDDDLVGTPLSA